MSLRLVTLFGIVLSAQAARPYQQVCAHVLLGLGEDAAFRWAIVANPTDHTAALAYADYLQEKGDSVNVGRADAIRLAIDLERNPPSRRSWIARQLRGDRKEPDPRLATLARLQTEAGWLGHPVLQSLGFTGTLEFKNGIPVGAYYENTEHATRDAVMYSTSVRTNVLQAFPDLHRLRFYFAIPQTQDPKRENTIMYGSEYFEAVLRGQVGPLFHFVRHTALPWDGSIEQRDVFLFFPKLFRVLHDLRPRDIHRPTLDIIAGIVEHIALLPEARAEHLYLRREFAAGSNLHDFAIRQRQLGHRGLEVVDAMRNFEHEGTSLLPPWTERDWQP